jgi:hypothetical protein
LAFTTTGSSIGYSETALRFGLMNIKPIQVVETIKRFGVKFKRVTRGFDTLTPSKSYSDLVSFKNEAILGSIEIPEWFDATKLIEVYSQRSIDSFKNDEELQKEIETLRKAERIGRPLLSFAQYIRQRFESEMEEYLEIEAHRFLNSNLPLSFYNKLVVFDKTYCNFLKILEDIVRMYEFRASASRNFAMYQKTINKMKKQIAPLIDQVDQAGFAVSRLKKYVSIWNSKDYSEIHYPKYLDIKKVDLSLFEELTLDCNKRLIETRELMLEYNENALQQEIDFKDTTTKMFGKLLMLPSTSYTW